MTEQIKNTTMISSAATPWPDVFSTTLMSVLQTVDAPETWLTAEMRTLDKLMMPSIKNIEVFISKNISAMRGSKCLTSTSSKPKLDALMTWNPTNATIKISSTSAMPTITSHRLNTVLLLAISGVDLVKNSNALRNGEAMALMIDDNSPVTALMIISIKPLFSDLGVTACRFGRFASFGFCTAWYEPLRIETIVTAASTMTSPITAFLAILLACSMRSGLPLLVM